MSSIYYLLFVPNTLLTINKMVSCCFLCAKLNLLQGSRVFEVYSEHWIANLQELAILLSWCHTAPKILMLVFHHLHWGCHQATQNQATTGFPYFLYYQYFLNYLQTYISSPLLYQHFKLPKLSELPVIYQWYLIAITFKITATNYWMFTLVCASTHYLNYLYYPNSESFFFSKSEMAHIEPLLH